jgi:lipid A 4'-phosphatase
MSAAVAAESASRLRTISPAAAWLTRLALAALILAVLFRLWPDIDLWAAGWFFRPGEGFFLKESLFAWCFYHAINGLKWIVIAGLASAVAYAAWRRNPPFGLSWPALMLVVGTFALGPGLLVNAVLKDHWGRARPTQVEAFGGAKRFTPPTTAADQCARNCSFPAGHPSLVFGFYALVLVRRRDRRWAAVAVTLLGAAAGLGRMMQGAHFLGDVIASGLLTGAVALALHLVLERGEIVGMAQAAHRGAREAAQRFDPRALLAMLLGAIKGGLWALISAPFIATIVLAAVLIGASLRYADKVLALWLKQQSGSFVTKLFQFVTDFGKASLLLIGTAAAALLLWLVAHFLRNAEWAATLYRRAGQAFFVFACVAAPAAVGLVAKIVIGRARPELLFGNGTYGFFPIQFDSSMHSMPSGHTLATVGFAAGLALVTPPAALAPIAFFATMVGFSRVLTTAHFLSDALAGAALAILCAIVLKRMFKGAGADLFGAWDETRHYR